MTAATGEMGIYVQITNRSNTTCRVDGHPRVQLTANGHPLDVVYAGLGSEADFAGRDVRGKAVLLFSMPLPGSWRHTATAEQAIRRAQDKGAAAIRADCHRSAKLITSRAIGGDQFNLLRPGRSATYPYIGGSLLGVTAHVLDRGTDESHRPVRAYRHSGSEPIVLRAVIGGDGQFQDSGGWYLSGRSDGATGFSV